MSDWFYNMGIVGLERIMNYAKKYKSDQVEYFLHENYIEFDSQILENFADYYFDYFISNYIKNEYERKIEIVRNAKDYKALEKVVDDISKKYKSLYGEEQSKNIKKDLSNKKEDLEAKKKRILELLEDSKLREKFAIDYIRNIMYDNFFGQMGFLQKTLANASVDRHKEIFKEQFITPLLEDIYVEEWISGLTDKPDFLENQNNDIAKKFKKFAKQKAKGGIVEVSLFKDFLEHTYEKCSICDEHYCTSEKDIFDEIKFVPLGISQKSPNFFWNYNFSYPICKVCKLVLMCTPAGVTPMSTLTSIHYDEMKPTDRREQTLLFVNADSDIETLIALNGLMKEKVQGNVYEQLIMDIVERYEKKAEWTLQNILFVEFNAKYESKKAKLKYVHLPKYVAKFLINRSIYVKNIYDYNTKEIFLSRIIYNGDLDEVIYKKLGQIVKEERKYDYDGYNMIISKTYLNMYRRGQENMGNAIRAKVESARDLGLKMRKELESKNEDNKIQTIAYKLLNAAKTGDKNLFLDTLLRLYINRQLEVPNVLLDMIHESTVDFETLAQSYIVGLITDTSKKIEEENNEN